MKKLIYSITIFLVSVFMTVSCVSTPKTTEIFGTTEIIEHKGTAFGVSQPEWVGAVLTTTNQDVLKKVLNIDKHIWKVSKSGENLDFVKTWADQVDARAEITASIQQGVSDFVGAKMKGDQEEIEETIERFSARASAIIVSGLNKETEWWVLSRTTLDKKNNVKPKYTYIVIYSLDEDLYAKQIKKAFRGEDEKIVDELIDYLMDYTMSSRSE